MKLVQWEKLQNTGLITMVGGENRHNPEFLEAMLGALDEIEADKSIKAVVIESSDPKFWSLGIDLNWMMGIMGNPEQHGDIRKFLYRLNDLFKRLLTYPMPVIAAMGGHAFGDGSIMACACDFRLMRTDRGFFCFPEVDINIPFLPGMMAIVRNAVPTPALQKMVLSGARIGGEELMSMGVVVETADSPEQLHEKALALAATFDKNRGVFGELKTRMHKHILAAIQDEDPAYIEPLQLLA